mgnify:CR=1 FL=1
MNIEGIRSKLRRLEDTICISLFERSQFKLNNTIYEAGKIHIPNFGGSFFEYLFSETEKVHASAGRYIDPEEHPFFIKPNEPLIPRKKDEIDIDSVVNLNNQILLKYMVFLPRLCQQGDDNKYGSAAVTDIYCLQALSRRIHIGEQVAEAKYREDIPNYDKLILVGDTNGIVNKLRNITVEKENLERIKEKSNRYNIPGEIVSEFFEKVVMPLTIRVEVDYFMSKEKK